MAKLLCLECSQVFEPQRLEDECCRPCMRLQKARAWRKSNYHNVIKKDPVKLDEYRAYCRDTMRHRRKAANQ